MNAMNSFDKMLDEQPKPKVAAKKVASGPVPFKVALAINTYLENPLVLEVTSGFAKNNKGDSKKVVRYLKDWTDDKIAEVVTKAGTQCEGWMVKQHRLDNFGMLERGALISGTNVMNSAEFERRFAVVQQAMNVIAEKADENFRTLQHEITGKGDAIANLQRKQQALFNSLDDVFKDIREIKIELGKLKLSLKHKPVG